ncbi:RES family NAD+ phosphorylase [Rhodococcus sp. TAF43]|uniref:RES family NAD+ phosphorylase n=1 Tax=Rhodococcus sp. TAF43 TaxID=3237483 RepID=UPI003F95B635
MSAPRNRLHLTEPPTPNLLTGNFPSYTYAAGSQLHRVHGKSFAPWWFGSNGRGRFDLAEPAGTCYTAEAEVVALLETWGGMQVVPSYDVDDRAISTIRVDTDRTVADLTSNLSAQFGITAEIFTTGNYQLEQRWAAALHAAGYHGLRYWARHDLAHVHACVAVFDTAGDLTGSPAYGVTNTTDLNGRTDLIGMLRTETGIVVLPVPPL